MKKLFLILFLAISYLSNAQVPTGLPTLFNGKWYKFTQYLQADSGFFNPQRDTMFIPNRAGCVVFRTADSILYIYTGSRWKGVGSVNGSGVYNAGYGLNLTSGTFNVDSSFISTKLWRQKGVDSLNAIKLNKSDTATMLLPYLRKADTTAMLLPYLRKGDTAAMLSPYLRKNDTITLSNRINLKVNISDTSTMLLPYLRKVDTTAMLTPYIKDAGYGLIKSTKSLSTDTFKLATRPYLHGRLDSLSVINSLLFLPFYSNVKTVADVNYNFSTDVDGYKWNYVIFSNNSSSGRTITLPTASSNMGRVITLISTDTAFKRDFVLGGSDTIIDLAGVSVGFLSSTSTYTIIAISTGWLVFQKVYN
jgi:hypothetical protein